MIMKKRTRPTTSTPNTTAEWQLSDELRLLSFNVGHGDCTLLEYHQENVIAFRCLVDAGQSLPVALLEHLRKHPRATGAPDIDVLVLSHVDADHLGGFSRLLAEGVSIGEYLGPCLPTFRRLQWLFAPRIQTAVDKASAFEADLIARKIPVCYPLEGFTASYVASRVTLSVISPAARLLESLSTLRNAELSALLMRHPLPLQWLLEPGGDEPQDDSQQVRDLFRGRISLSPGDFDGDILASTGLPPEALSSASASLETGLEPDFFGNAVLNDTSLILVVDVHLNANYRRRIVLTGDQENWTYIAARHPGGLGVDVVKAPHHGGRVYMDDRTEAVDSLYLWLRPRTVVVSANGRHSLPRNSFRDSMRKIGATLICPNVRGIEPLSAGMTSKPSEKSCFAAMACTSPSGGVTTLRLTGDGDSSDARACVQGAGHSGAAPIVVLRQDIIPASESLVRYTRRELEKHGEWIKGTLAVRHKEFLSRTEGTNDEFAVRAQMAAAEWSSIAILAKAAERHDLVADPGPVLSFAHSQRFFWINTGTHRMREEHKLYRLPLSSEIESALQWVARVPRILLRGTYEARALATRDPIDILSKAGWQVLDSLIGAKLSVPVELVEDEIRPLILPLIANTFSLRICPTDYPHSEPRPGDLYLLLEQKTGAASSALPALSLSGPIWDSICNWHNTKPEAPWDALHQFAKTEMLFGIFFDRSRYGHSSLMDPFTNGLHKKTESVAARFLSANWTCLW
ncbi:MAG TPA: MBL fold metallo-hydrolase [Rhodocyclaceae bacterium]|nr:MBL fold metallo-hydrolase [Rhodocyclaceae bacterium]